MRDSELAHLHKDWLSLQHNKILIPNRQECTNGEKGGWGADCKQKYKNRLQTLQKHEKEGKSYFFKLQEDYWYPKTKLAVRAIPLPRNDPRMVMVLRAWFVFHDNIGISRQRIAEIVKNVGNSAQLTGRVYPHALRATYASILACAGVSSPRLRGIMGWSKLETAENYITRFGPGAQEWIDKVNS